MIQFFFQVSISKVPLVLWLAYTSQQKVLNFIFFLLKVIVALARSEKLNRYIYTPFFFHSSTEIYCTGNQKIEILELVDKLLLFHQV